MKKSNDERKPVLTLEVKIFDLKSAEKNGKKEVNVSSEVSINGNASANILTVAVANLMHSVYNHILKDMKNDEDLKDNPFINDKILKRFFMNELKHYFDQFNGEEDDETNDKKDLDLFELLTFLSY